MALQHVAMFPAMLAAMALRPLEYGACETGLHGSAGVMQNAPPA
jgi:hypothetical protein